MRKDASMLLIWLLSLVLTGCGPSVRPEGDDDNPCAESETFCGTNVAGEPICVDPSSDASHCGACHNDCRLPEANACVGGLCACVGGNGNVSDECDGDTACAGETGQCIAPDRTTSERCDPIEGTGCDDPRKVCADSYCTVPDCGRPESCDGLDNDCDGHLDGTGPLPGEIELLSRPCYTGPPGTENVGICGGGRHLCLGGIYSANCTGEQTPVAEDGILRCDGVDNDCDTCADNQRNEGTGECEPMPPLKADVVFIIDRSGSMYGTIGAVKLAVHAWAENIGTNPNIRFALVNPTLIEDPDGVAVTQGLTNFAAFNAVLDGIDADGDSREPMHYATQLVLNGSFDGVLGFAPGSIRFAIAIHDEPTTDAGNAVPGYGETSVCDAVPPDTVLAVITYAEYFQEWDQCTSSTAMPPTAFTLTSDAATMLAQLNQIIENPCF